MKGASVLLCLLAGLILFSSCRGKAQVQAKAKAPKPRSVIVVPLSKEERIIRKAEQPGITPEPREVQPAVEEGALIEIPHRETIEPEGAEGPVTRDMVRVEGGKFKIGHIDPSCTNAARRWE